MKRLLCILLILALSLPGCAFKKNRMQEPVTFYYLHKHETEDHYDTFFTSGAIGFEVREAANHRDNLPYLLVKKFSVFGKDSKLCSLIKNCQSPSKSLVGQLITRAVTTCQREIEWFEPFRCLRYLAKRKTWIGRCHRVSKVWIFANTLEYRLGRLCRDGKYY